MNIRKCTECHEPTKTVSGFWDGIDENGRRTSGNTYSCSNNECPLMQEEINDMQEIERRVIRAKEENLRNGVDILNMVRARREAELTIKDLAQVLGVSLSEYCDYERERKPMPKDKWNKIMVKMWMFIKV